MDWPSKPTTTPTIKKKARVVMSTYLFLDKGKIEIHSAFNKTPYKDGSGDRMSYHLHQISADDGRLRTTGNINAPIPDDIAEFVTEVTHHEFVPHKAIRESGLYRLGSASCELFPAQSERPCHWLRITGTKTEEMKELRAQVLGGLIHPEISYESPTAGPTRRQLLDSLAELQIKDIQSQEKIDDLVEGSLKLEAERKRLADELAVVEQDRDRTKAELTRTSKILGQKGAQLEKLRIFVMTLQNRRLSLSRRKKIIGSLEGILYGSGEN